MAFKIQFTAAARRDILETTDYLRDRDTKYATRWLKGILATTQSLQDMPSRHALIWEADELERPLRALVFHAHRIVYEVNEPSQTVNIIRIYHSARHPLEVEDIES